MEPDMKIVSTVSPSRSPSNLTSKAVPSMTLCVVLLRQPTRISLQRNLSSASPDSVNCYLSEAVPSTTLCVVLLRQPLRTLLQRREIQTSSEIGFSCS
uniref:Uncharacterized protein n=1 Tax=Brassica oleracea var. oleracea TaxID=109376 RepID=A0A0D3CA18_BRAOL